MSITNLITTIVIFPIRALNHPTINVGVSTTTIINHVLCINCVTNLVITLKLVDLAHIHSQHHKPISSRNNPGGNNNHNWTVDFSASHHITSDSQNLLVYSKYGGNDDIIIGDGYPVPITHIGSTNLVPLNPLFDLTMFCVHLKLTTCIWFLVLSSK